MGRSRTILIGDVHGMLPELQQLLQQVAPGPQDQLVSCGDLLDRGPDSPGVVRTFRQLRESGHDVVLVKGNHEDRHQRYRRALTRPGPVKMHGVQELERIAEGLSEADVAFLDSAVMVHWLHAFGALVVHAGVLPTTVSVDPPDPQDKRAVRRHSLLMRVRHVTGRPMQKKNRVRRAGSFVVLGEETPDDPFWADVYDGRFGHIYFGHQAYVDQAEPVRFPHATGLDLGACFGGRLAAAILEQGQPVRFVSVPAHAKYATTLEEDRAAERARRLEPGATE